jgi:hypothetical protein
MIARGRYLILLAASLGIGATILLGCNSDKDPRSLLGKSLGEAQIALSDSGSVVYVRRGVADPNSYSGQILLSPYAIRQPVKERLYAQFVYCNVKAGKIVDCQDDFKPNLNVEIIEWFRGKELADVPLEFYVEAPDDTLVGWIDLDTFTKSKENFNGVVAFHGSENLYFLRFYDGECVGVEVERN